MTFVSKNTPIRLRRPLNFSCEAASSLPFPNAFEKNRSLLDEARRFRIKPVQIKFGASPLENLHPVARPTKIEMGLKKQMRLTSLITHQGANAT